MPSISYDGQSLQVDGRRIWLVSGSLPYARIPQSQWRDRINDARNLGLNCVDVMVPWRIHEPQPGQFDFTGQADVKLFIQMLIEQGMWCTLRVGPFVGDGWELGGIPPWVLAQPGVKLRQANSAWLEACSRYLGALLAQVRDLQVTSPHATARLAQGPSGAGGIVLMQAEHQWLCHHPQQGETYLREIVRYLRENGCEVPITSCNNLWQTVEGTFDTWCASEHLAADLRQLAVIQPQAPRMVSDLLPAADSDGFMRQLAGVVAAGGQFNVSPLMQGVFDGFTRGCDPAPPDQHEKQAGVIGPESEISSRAQALKRVATFCSHFAPALAHAQPTSPPVVLSPQTSSPGVAILGQNGSQGRITFLIRTADHDHPIADLLLPTGLSLPVPLGKHPVAWIGMDINLSGSAQLTLTNLRPWAWIGKRMLVLFGPAGAKGLVTINDAPLTLDLPGDKEAPVVVEHEEVLVVVLSEDQVDTAWLVRDGLVVGASDVDANDEPQPLAGNKPLWRVDLQGKVSTRKSQRKQQGKGVQSPRLSNWQSVDALKLVADVAADPLVVGDMSLEALDPPSGLGWYRLQFHANPKAGTVLAVLRNSGKLHFFSQGKAVGVMDAQQTSKLTLKKDALVLVENPGRFSEGWRMHQQTGLAGDLLAIKPMKLPAGKWSTQTLPSPLSHEGYLRHLRQQPRWTAEVLSWSIAHRRKTSLLLDIQQLPVRVMVLINNAIAGVYDPHECAGALQVHIDAQNHLKQGSNHLQIACLENLSATNSKTRNQFDANRLARYLTLYECVESLTDKAQIAFQPWQLPPADAYAMTAGKTSGPLWHRATFAGSKAPGSLSLLTTGLSRGQIHLNGQNVGRYDNTTSTKSKKEAISVHLPTAWLQDDKPNELVLFDVFGKSPRQCKLVPTKTQA